MPRVTILWPHLSLVLFTQQMLDKLGFLPIQPKVVKVSDSLTPRFGFLMIIKSKVPLIMANPGPLTRFQNFKLKLDMLLLLQIILFMSLLENGLNKNHKKMLSPMLSAPDGLYLLMPLAIRSVLSPLLVLLAQSMLRLMVSHIKCKL
jgi:hypothetical protein